jgi:hypothetical protein
MPTEAFRFKKIGPRKWLGRYRKPVGEESVYHVTARNEIEVRWKDPDLFFTYECSVKETLAVNAMAEEINSTKLRYAGRKGGSFVINEFGQVICPIANSSDRYLVGESDGPLYFKDEKNGSGKICLCDCDRLTCGDDWDRPYIGMKYQLHAGDHIYFWDENGEGGTKQYPVDQDEELIENLRQIRPNGGVSFLVNQHGIVLVKMEMGRNKWKAIYVGKINYKRWFKKEG